MYTMVMQVTGRRYVGLLLAVLSEMCLSAVLSEMCVSQMIWSEQYVHQESADVCHLVPCKAVFCQNFEGHQVCKMLSALFLLTADYVFCVIVHQDS